MKLKNALKDELSLEEVKRIVLEDYRLALEKFKKAASYVDLRVLDHLIVSEKGYFSFADEEII